MKAIALGISIADGDYATGVRAGTAEAPPGDAAHATGNHACG